MRYFLFIVLTVMCSSCIFQKRAAGPDYLESYQDTNFRKTVFIAEPVLQKNDLLSIQIYSASLDPMVDRDYNQSTAAASSVQTAQLGGYLIDVNGNIELPRIGTIKAEGLKKSELEAIIKNKLKAELTNPGVVIRFLNFRITVLGEVGSPGVLTIPTERLTILEAVGMAGGITQYGRIKQVKVLRENNGVRQLGLLDLTSSDIFQSPYYQLQQNDVVLVDQNTLRVDQAEETRRTQQISIGLSIITTLALLYNLFK